MNSWLLIALTAVASFEFVCIMILMLVMRSMARELSEGRQIIPVEVHRDRDDRRKEEIRKPDPYWIGPGIPDEDDGR